jgi:CheY-like chemotaxis protein
MEFWLFLVIGAFLAAVSYFGSDPKARNWAFYVLWIIGVGFLVTGIFLYLSVPLFDQDLQVFPYYRMALASGLILLIMSQVAAIVTGRTAVYSQIAEERQQRAISEITQVAVSSSSLMELLNFTLDKVCEMLGMSGGSIHVFHRARGNLVLGSYKGLSARLARRLETVEMGETAIGRTARNRRLLIIRNLRLSPDYEFFGGRTEGFSYLALIPVISEGEHWGVISLLGRGVYRPGMLQVDLLEQFGEQLGASLVLGRRMRGAQASLENMRGILNSLGDELYVDSKIGRGGEGAARAIAWSLTRMLDGDRFDLCRFDGKLWRIELSSEPEAHRQVLNLNADSGFSAEWGPSGIIGWDKPPPFEEFIERRPYIFCSLPGKALWMFVRLETRRRPSVDFDLFFNVCRIVQGLLLRLPARKTEGTTAERPLTAAGPGTGEADQGLMKPEEEIKVAFDQISGDLERLISQYSASGNDSEMKGLIKWLEVIKKSADQSATMTRSFLKERKTEKGRKDDFISLVKGTLDEMFKEEKKGPGISFDVARKRIAVGYPASKVKNAVRRFLDLAVKEGAPEQLRLTAAGGGDEISLEIEGEKLPEAPADSSRPRWLTDVKGRIEFAHSESDESGPRDRWRLIIPQKKAKAESSEERKKPSVLAVESQDVIRDLLTSMLTNIGYESVVVASSEQALGVFNKNLRAGRAFDIVIADNVLDRMSGLELAVQVRSLRPDTDFILISGWGPDPDPVEIEKAGIKLTLKKPFRFEQLSEAIDRVLAAGQK